MESTVTQSGKIHLRKNTQNKVTGEVQKQLKSEKQPEDVLTNTRLNFNNTYTLNGPLHSMILSKCHEWSETI